jgi:hypothetical protein
MTLCLTEEELIQLTGKRQGKGMAHWLRENEFVFKMGADGIPRVDRDHYRRKMDSLTTKAPRGPRLHGLRSA